MHPNMHSRPQLPVMGCFSCTLINRMHYKKLWFQLYVRSQKVRYFGHWLSDENTLEVKNFDTQLVFICNTFNYKPKISTKPQNVDF